MGVARESGAGNHDAGGREPPDYKYPETLEVLPIAAEIDHTQISVRAALHWLNVRCGQFEEQLFELQRLALGHAGGQQEPLPSTSGAAIQRAAGQTADWIAARAALAAAEEELRRGLALLRQAAEPLRAAARVARDAALN